MATTLAYSIVRNLNCDDPELVKQAILDAARRLKKDGNFPERKELIAELKKIVTQDSSFWQRTMKLGGADVGDQRTTDEFRVLALTALSKAKEPEAQEFLFRMAKGQGLEKTKFKEICEAEELQFKTIAILIQENKGSPEENSKIADILLGIMRTDKSTFSGSKAAAVKMLPEIINELPKKKRDEVMAELIKTVETDSSFFGARFAAIYALGEIGDRAAVPCLVALLKDEEMGTVFNPFSENSSRLTAAYSLAKIGDLAALDVLEKVKGESGGMYSAYEELRGKLKENLKGTTPKLIKKS